MRIPRVIEFRVGRARWLVCRNASQRRWGVYRIVNGRQRMLLVWCGPLFVERVKEVRS